ncbi:hypothetical protein [Exiguobacterium aurantiacum]|uniref:Uncharacterized protein n=1 Tax=Exiguobacterium aurantiacum TaxID=33987 RepID=A0ABY5FMJ0_9BACL|nr:hypothetical protein [Exiguobacterium aurantiacum]UTT42604.1 hypothetical protein NMQ00_13895 [Exiguobacterium aurantiacum]
MMRFRAMRIEWMHAFLTGLAYIVPTGTEYVSELIRGEPTVVPSFLFYFLPVVIGFIIQTWSGIVISLLSGLLMSTLFIRLVVWPVDVTVHSFYTPGSVWGHFYQSTLLMWVLALIVYVVSRVNNWHRENYRRPQK